MAAAETARLIASLELQDKNFTRGIRNVERGVNRVDKKLGAFSGFINRNMARAIDSIGVRLVSQVSIGLEELATLEDATTSVTGAIAQVGKGWTLTADDIATAANKIEADTDAAFDDKAIVAATTNLIRYGKVTESNVLPAMEVMTDLAARTGDVESASRLLAKALADPVKALGALRKAGVILSKSDEKRLKQLVKAGKVTEAQTFLLERLGETTKGAAEASAGPYRDALNKLADAGEDLRRGFVMGLAPAILEVSDLLTTELAKPSTMNALKNAGKEIGSALKGLIGIVKSLPWDTIGASLKLAGTGAKAVLDAFLAMPSWVQAAVLTGWGLNKLTGGALSSIIGSLASGLIKGVLGMNAGVVNINAGVVNGGGMPGVPGKGGPGLLGTAARLVIPVAIASITVAAATAITDAINPSFGRRLAEGDTPLSPRDPRRFDKFGRVVAEFKGDLTDAGNKVDTLGVKFGRMAPKVEALGVRFGRIDPKKPARDAKTEKAAQAEREQAVKIQAVKNQIKNAQSIASRENSAQKDEIARAKQATATAGRNTTNATNRVPPAVRSNALTVSSSMSAAASRIVSAVNALDLVVNVTTVNRTSTVNNRYGPSGGSSTTNRSGELE